MTEGASGYVNRVFNLIVLSPFNLPNWNQLQYVAPKQKLKYEVYVQFLQKGSCLNVRLRLAPEAPETTPLHIWDIYNRIRQFRLVQKDLDVSVAFFISTHCTWLSFLLRFQNVKVTYISFSSFACMIKATDFLADKQAH